MPTVRRICELGGVAIVGSVNNVHSASGSSFIKAFNDGLLYRGDTVGEALRDARNYFLSLAVLKEKRDHKETAKVRRVALSFCLWGDPELSLYRAPLRPKHSLVRAVFADPQTLRISTPRRRLREYRNDRYLGRLFPGSQVAGIVRRLKDSDVRRIAPLYFFRLPYPADFDPAGFSSLQRPGDAPNRVVFMADTLGRFLYVLYFPGQEARREEFELCFCR
jgi:hypothetical protein